MSTPLSELIPSLRETVFKHLQSYLGGEGELSSIMESLEFWYDRLRDKEYPELPMWENMPSNEQDQLFDAWHSALEDFWRERLTKSDLATIRTEKPVEASSLFKPVADQCPECGLSGAHFCTGGQPSHPGWSSQEASLPVSSPSPASSPLPSPLVPEVVKEAVEALSWILSVSHIVPVGVDVNTFLKAKERAYMALEGLRNYSPAPSPSVPKEVLSPEELKRRNYHEIYG